MENLFAFQDAHPVNMRCDPVKGPYKTKEQEAKETEKMNRGMMSLVSKLMGGNKSIGEVK